DGVTVYSDDAEVTTKVIGDKLKSTYVKKFAFIADHDFEIPARSLSAYDPQTKETKTLEIPAYSIKVEASHHPAAAVQKGTGSQSHSGVVQTDLKLDNSAHSKTAEPVKRVVQVPAWWMLLAAFVAGMLTMFLLGKVSWRPKAPTFKEKDALKVLYAHMSEDPKVEAMVRKLYAKKNGQKDVIIDKKELKALMEKYAK
ncbi:MAG: hypothetical protein L3J47_11905, partial [Sulfurovum sp.]|nr:hypothetical protein [Sulfurovum sp.]